jgi:hypothetical protein
MRELVAFDGPVQWQRAEGAVGLELRGTTRGASGRGGGAPVEVLFSGVSAPPLPSNLRDVRVLTQVSTPGDVPAQRLFSIETPDTQLELRARAVQVHRQAARPFYAAIPATPVPLRVRLGWSVLLSALRLPGAGRLLRKLRGST